MKNFLLVLLVFWGTTIYAQVGIGTPIPSASVMLDVVANDKGVMIPRVSLTGSTDVKTIINGNQPSLLVYNTATFSDVKPGYYYWNGVDKWNRIMSADDMSAAVAATAHTLGSAVNTLTSDVNGVSKTARIINENLLEYSDQILNNHFFEMPYTILHLINISSHDS